MQGQGNDALKRGLQLKKKFYLREAIGMYTKGLEMGSTLPQLQSVLHSNRAQAHLLLEKYRSALEDSLQAIQLHDTNLKVPDVCWQHACTDLAASISGSSVDQCLLTCLAGLLQGSQSGAQAGRAPAGSRHMQQGPGSRRWRYRAAAIAERGAAAAAGSDIRGAEGSGARAGPAGPCQEARSRLAESGV